MDHDWLDQYEVFYEELPGASSSEIAESEDTIDENVGQFHGGLSSEQVSQIAFDALDMNSQQEQTISPQANELLAVEATDDITI